MLLNRIIKKSELRVIYLRFLNFHLFSSTFLCFTKVSVHDGLETQEQRSLHSSSGSRAWGWEGVLAQGPPAARHSSATERPHFFICKMERALYETILKNLAFVGEQTTLPVFPSSLTSVILHLLSVPSAVG